MKILSRRAAAVLALMLSAADLNACTDQTSIGSVTVLAPWLGSDPDTEGYAFRKVLANFTADTGIQVNYQETRALAQVLLSSVPGGTAPDVAVLTSPGDLAKFARSGKLRPLDDVLDDRQRNAYNPSWLLSEGEHIYTVPIKANLKSIIWYNPARATQPVPSTWEGLVAFSRDAAARGTTPWCMGMGDAPLSGWPGVDLINDIFLHRFGPGRYRSWAFGKLPWTSDAVREAWTSWGEFAADPGFVHGGRHTVLLTDFKDAGRPMFGNPPGCLLEHQASFIMSFYRRYRDLPLGIPKPVVDFNFAPFPAAAELGAGRFWETSIDLAGMFNDTPQARALMRFLSTDDAQKIWPGIEGGSAFTVNKNVDPAIYGNDEISRKIAGVFRSTDTLCFSASDIMPATMRYAYFRAVLEYLADPTQLAKILQKLDQIRIGIPSEEWLDLPCGSH